MRREGRFKVHFIQNTHIDEGLRVSIWNQKVNKCNQNSLCFFLCVAGHQQDMTVFTSLSLALVIVITNKKEFLQFEFRVTLLSLDYMCFVKN